MAKKKHRHGKRSDTRSEQSIDGEHDVNGKGARRGLKGGHKGSRGDGQDWLFGTHAVLAAIENPDRTIRSLLATEDARPVMDAALSVAKDEEINRPTSSLVERSALNQQLPDGAVHQGMAAQVAPLEECFLEDIIIELKDVSPALVVIIDQGTDPRNVGSVMRSAAAFGAAAVLVQDRHSPGTTGVLAKAASGALETVPLVRVKNLSRSMDQLEEAEFWCVGLDGEAKEGTDSLDWPQRTVLVLGSEGKGLRRMVREHCDILARIPMTPAMESLNLSNAAAIAMYENYRQKLASSS
ncbi:MAG: 23S rRNA (guanosine(2251)-2'-O)-methyltransferase RlmB [Rhodospirillales bacterium]|nr:23S rRNA (guanosine(2251)-2'-O)-methyltransferase RlmB [Rhodospirillales bacterium]